MLLPPPGKLFAGFLDSVYQNRPLKIVETGTMRDLTNSAEYSDGWSTINIARWVKTHPECEFHSVDLNVNAIELSHLALEAEGLAKYCTFHLQDSIKFLGDQSWIDMAFLDSCDGLEHGRAEWRLAASAGARLIIMDDLQSKAMWAIKEARELGWNVTFADRYSVFRRPA